MNKPITIMLPIVPPTKTHQNKKIVNIGKHAKLADTKELKLVISDYLTLLKPYQPADGAGLPEAGLRLALPQERAEKKPDRAHSENDQTGLGQPGQNPAGCPDPVEILGG
jgi:hypothetical protein